MFRQEEAGCQVRLLLMHCCCCCCSIVSWHVRPRAALHLQPTVDWLSMAAQEPRLTP